MDLGVGWGTRLVSVRARLPFVILFLLGVCRLEADGEAEQGNNEDGEDFEMWQQRYPGRG